MDPVSIGAGQAVILDFDGTVCLLFKNYPLDDTVARLRCRMQAFGVRFEHSTDPFDVFSAILEQLPPDRAGAALSAADEILSDAETEAVGTCEPIPGLLEFLEKLRAGQVPVGIASNNSGRCVKAFLERFCNDRTMPVAGRVGAHPERMKPDPWSILQVAGALHTPPQSILFIGDTPRDLQGARNAGCRFLGIAPTEKKYLRLKKALPDAEPATDYFQLIEQLRL